MVACFCYAELAMVMHLVSRRTFSWLYGAPLRVEMWSAKGLMSKLIVRATIWGSPRGLICLRWQALEGYRADCSAAARLLKLKIACFVAVFVCLKVLGVC